MSSNNAPGIRNRIPIASKSRKTKCILGGLVVALLTFVTWRTEAARTSALTATGSAVKVNPTAAPNITHLAPRRLLAQAAPTVATDKSDYAPGSTVTVTGSGWAPGETVVLTFPENPNNDGPHILSTVADGSGNIRTTDFVVSPQDSGITFTLTAVGGSSGQTATTTFTDACGSGSGVVTVAGNGGSCVVGTPPHAGGPYNWEVAGGGSYTKTISNEKKCTGDTIRVFVKNTTRDNFCFNAKQTSPGVYPGTSQMPTPACNTYPISYKCGADQPCNNQNTTNAQGPDGACTVHL